MATSPSIHGLVCPMVTPFDAQGRIDFGLVRPLVDHLLAGGVDVLFPCGTTGEGMLLDPEERKTLSESVIEHVAGRAPVIVHTGWLSTSATVDLTRHARAAGASAATVITPFFHGLDDDALFEHFVSIARSVPEFPIFLYAFPANARNDISPRLLRRLRDAAPNIVGIKSSNPDLLRFHEYVEIGGDDFIPLCGVDGLMLPALAVGARGQVSGNANAFPELFKALYNAFVAGDLQVARAHQRMINRVRTLLRDGFHPAYYKAALALRGVAAGYVRPPMRELTPAELAELATGIRQLGLV